MCTLRAGTLIMNLALSLSAGAEMLFAALFSVTFLGRKLNRYHLAGMACCVVGGRTLHMYVRARARARVCVCARACVRRGLTVLRIGVGACCVAGTLTIDIHACTHASMPCQSIGYVCAMFYNFELCHGV